MAQNGRPQRSKPLPLKPSYRRSAPCRWLRSDGKGQETSRRLTVGGSRDRDQTRVHRRIAPILAATVKRDLARSTENRYTYVIVDPTLQVQVRGGSGNWRNAGRLSHGTAEQVYLLLRIAFADHLTNGHDTYPLLLDDVT